MLSSVRVPYFFVDLCIFDVMSALNRHRKWIIALTGASGLRYGLRLVQIAAQLLEEIHLVFSDAALRVLAEEEGIKVTARSIARLDMLSGARARLQIYNNRDIGAGIASGSMLMDGMVIVPCSMGTLGAVAHGLSQNLIHRAADVTLKEKRTLVLVPRETPLSTIHLENMLSLSRLGVAIVPAMPGFYHEPKSIDDLVDMMVMKILDQMGIETQLVNRWMGTGESNNRRDRFSASAQVGLALSEPTIHSMMDTPVEQPWGR